MADIPLIGYADRLSVAPGGRIEFKVSSTSPGPYAARLVRVASSDPNPRGPGVVEHPVEAAFAGTYPSRFQPVHLGSHMQLADTGPLDAITSFSLVATIWPTTPACGLQGVVSRRTPGGGGIALAVDADGVSALVGGTRIAVGKPLVERRWYRVWAAYDAAQRWLTVGQAPLHPAPDADDAGTAGAACPEAPAASGELFVAAMGGVPVAGHFNGKVERPVVLGAALDPDTLARVGAGGDHPAILACWDFAQEIPTPRAVDVGPHGLDGRLVNLPTRAVKGALWDGTAFDWKQAPDHYAAVHFHDDDIYDCEWQTDFAFDVPPDTRSGVYGVRLESAEGDQDMIPFFVTAPPGGPRSPIVVLVPTFTYTVYANIARGNTTDALRRTVAEWGAWPWNADDHPEFGLSTYNLHGDGSGICFASRRRPMITVRPATVCYPDVPGSALRHFAADAHLWHWLETMGHDFDVVTDDELHRDGMAAIAGYEVVMTTTHPEYHTRETLDALAGHVEGGGRLMYLGGNGFYWKVALGEGWPDAIEIRRGEGGIRAWAAEPGEYYNALDGGYGGLWRRNDRPPQKLCGVGFTAQGEHRGDGYRRTEASHRPEYAWAFEGIEEEVIGDFGLSGGGAAGFELDRADPRLGTPRNAVVLARSEGHGDHFVLVPEDVLTNLLSSNGEPFDELIRSDIVYFETGGGGAVFSVGSIAFCGSLPVDGCRNNVSRLVENVLRRFLRGDGSRLG